MNIWVAVTDTNWFRFLRNLRPDEVNFWQPGGSRLIRKLGPGDLFLFKLHSPHNAVAGGGFFVRSTALPVRLAWEAFRERNGVGSLQEFHGRIRKYRREAIPKNPQIGCNVLAYPFFFDETEWIPEPPSWSRNIVTAKTYDSFEGDGAELFRQVRQRLGADDLLPAGLPLADDGVVARYGEEFLTRARLGQGTFRILVTDAYQRRCAITGERTLPTLEAAHIKPYSESGPHRISNGLLLRSDWHRLFDDGYVTVTSEHRIEVSHRIREEYENGSEYYRHHGHSLTALPKRLWQQPSVEFIDWHNEHIYKG